MNRRGFLKFLGAATVGSAVAYSFPSIIVPKNIITLEEVNNDIILGDGTSLNYLNEIIRKEIYPRVLKDNFFADSPFFSRMRGKSNLDFSEGYVKCVDKPITKEEVKLIAEIEEEWNLKSNEMFLII